MQDRANELLRIALPKLFGNSGIALSSGCHLWVKGCEEALFGCLQRSDEDDGDPLQLFSKQFLHALR